MPPPQIWGGDGWAKKFRHPTFAGLGGAILPHFSAGMGGGQNHIFWGNLGTFFSVKIPKFSGSRPSGARRTPQITFWPHGRPKNDVFAQKHLKNGVFRLFWGFEAKNLPFWSEVFAHPKSFGLGWGWGRGKYPQNADPDIIHC